MELNRKNLSAVIIKTAQNFQFDNDSCSLEEINQGLCDDFAVTVMEQFFSPERVQELFYHEFNGAELVTNYEFDKKLDEHVWIVYKGRHYDAEAPYGVPSYNELPIYKRQFSKNKLIEIIREEIKQISNQ